MTKVKGLYIPQFYEPVYKEDGSLVKMLPHSGIPAEVERRWIVELDAYQAQNVIVTNDTEFKDMFLIEIARGCGRHCRFCMAGYCYRKPRNRSLATIKEAVLFAKKYRDKVGLMGAAISDYPDIDEMCDFIIEQGLHMSVASLRADSLTPSLVRALAKSGQRTITLAPEAGSDRMRKIINKGISEEDLFRSVNMAIAAGIPNIRLYIMIGLPFETEDDIKAISAMAKNIKAYMEELGSRGKLTLSVNPFIPKPFTPFQWLPMATYEAIEGSMKMLQKDLKQQKGIELLMESPKEAYIQAILARGDRRLGKVLLAAVEIGGSKGFKKALKSAGLEEAFYLYRERQISEVLPWNHLYMGFNPSYLVKELSNATQEIYTQRCLDGCKRCGVCK